MLTEDLDLQVQPQASLNLTYTPMGEAELLVKWQDLPDCENSWEPYHVLQQ